MVESQRAPSQNNETADYVNSPLGALFVLVVSLPIFKLLCFILEVPEIGDPKRRWVVLKSKIIETRSNIRKSPTVTRTL